MPGNLWHSGMHRGIFSNQHRECQECAAWHTKKTNSDTNTNITNATNKNNHDKNKNKNDNSDNCAKNGMAGSLTKTFLMALFG